MSERTPCCAPPAHRGAVTASRRDTGVRRGTGGHGIEQALLDGGRFQMGDARGDANPGDGETPVHAVELSPFSIDVTTVTNADFAAFVDDTGFVTEAERFEFSAVFHLALAAAEADVLQPAAGTPWWLAVRGADWRHPGGRRSSIDGLDDHPVVHVSWTDAASYASWAGRRLPTEAEWEYASRGGGPEGARYPWGDESPAAEGDWRCNIWQGRFPDTNDLTDGYLTTAPVRAFEPNGYGLWQTIGNVWEWCADWHLPQTYAARAANPDKRDPTGPPAGQQRVMRGGSYLCHDSYCNRYRNAARTSNTPDSSAGNIGFRTVGLATARPVEAISAS